MRKISIRLSHYGLKANGKRGRMMVVKDVQAVDNTVITDYHFLMQRGS